LAGFNNFSRLLQKWILLLSGFLILGLGAEYLTLFLQKFIHNKWALALSIMVVVGVVFTLAAEALSPTVDRSIKELHSTVKPGKGQLAGILAALLLLGGVYLAYYFTYK
jgi:hypothetical protein